MGKIKIAGINELIGVPDKQAQEIKAGLKSFMIKPTDYIEVGKWYGMAKEIKSFISDNEEEETKIWQKSTDELKEIIGEFETCLNSKRDNVPATLEGKKRAVQDGKLPDIGISWLEDRGVVSWYIQSGWLFTETPKDGEKRKWAFAQKYITDKIPQVEESLDELQSRRRFAEEEAIKGGDPVISEMYYKEKREKIAELRKILMNKLCRVGGV